MKRHAPAGRVRASRLDRALKPVHRWVWKEESRRARKLLAFAATEADGGRDLARAAELTSDALLRRLYLRHAMDEQRHAELFTRRAHDILAGLPRGAAPRFEARWLAPGERGLDDLQVEPGHDAALLAFLHLSEKAAAGRFALYREVLEKDRATHEVFGDILRDETFHMNYTRSQLVRVAPSRHRGRLWRARASRLWKSYLRFAVGLAGILGRIMMTAQYFIVLPLFALLARRAAKREKRGWIAAAPKDKDSLRSLYG
ncbi:MAG TPA: ferritin-like domain-containing protein [Kofleriaceae bacterium]|jgi:ferritin-like protein